MLLDPLQRLEITDGKTMRHNRLRSCSSRWAQPCCPRTEIRGADGSSQCLADLRTTDPRDDKKRIEAIKGGLLKGSYQWILDHPEFRRWRAGTVRRREHVAGEQAPAVAQLCSGRHSTMLTMAALPQPICCALQFAKT